MENIKKYIMCSIGLVLIICGLFYVKNNSNITTYNVSFETNGGSIVETQVVEEGGFATKPTNPQKNYNEFIQWNLDDIKFYFSTPINSDITLTAVWEESEYTVTFIVDNEVYNTQNVSNSNPLTIPNNPIKEGYYFEYWMVNEEKYDFDSYISTNITLEAKFFEISDDVQVFTALFQDENGNTLHTISVPEGAAIQEYTPEVRESQTFEYWTVNGIKYDFNLTVTSNITLVSKWKTKTFTISFETNGGSDMQDIVVEYGDILNIQQPTKSNSVFSHWEVDNTEFLITTPITSNLTLNAIWFQDCYTVLFITSFDQVPSQTIVKNELVIKPNDPVGDTDFLYWSYNNSEYDFNTPVTKDIVLIAVFADAEYTVTFETNSSTIIESQIVTPTQLVKMPPIPTREGYEFLYWSLDEKQFNFSTFLTSDITLTAVWQEITNDLNYYTITFNTVGGTAISYIDVVEGSIITSPTTTKDNYDFLYWSYNNVEYDFNTRIYTNMTLVANWKIHNFTVTFDSDGGSYAAPQIIDMFSKASKPTVSKNGYNFLYWTLDGVEYNFSTSITSDITLVAEWEKIIYYTVSYSSLGTSVDSQTVVSGQTAAIPYSPTRNNYSFSYWSLNGVQYDFSTPVTGNITLVANWVSLQEIVVQFDSQEGTYVETQVLEKLSYVMVPESPSREDYTFVYWMLDGKEFNFNTEVTENITLVAYWFYNPAPVIYTITFVSNNLVYKTLTAIENQYVTSFTMSDTTYYSFDRWEYANGEEFSFSTPVTSDATVYAVWNDRIYYTITYDYDGGSRSSTSTSTSVYPSTVESGKSLYLTGAAKKDFHTFSHWELPDGSKYVQYTYYPTGDFVLKAVYNEIELNLTYNDYTKTYDGYYITRTIDGSIPTGVTMEYENHSHRDVGVYYAIAYAKYNGEIIATYYCTITITQKTLTLTHTGTFIYEYTGSEIDYIVTTSGSGWGYYSSTSAGNVLKGSFYYTFDKTLLSVGTYTVNVELIRVVDGESVNNINYLLVNDSFTIEIISPRTYNFDYVTVDDGIEITGFYNSLQTTLVVPSSINGVSVTSIAPSAFLNQTNLISVELPSTMKTIGTSAFSGCTKLETITFGNSLISIGASAFNGCTSLKTISLPNTLTYLGASAFNGCKALTSVSLSNSLETIDNYAFSSCSALQTVDFGTSIITIGNYAFNSCSSLEIVSLPNTVTTIGNYTFSSCSSLNTLSLKENLLTIGTYAFQSCSSLTTVSLPNSITTIGERSFQNCTKLSSINIPDSLTVLNTRMFYQCYLLNQVTFGSNSSLTTIGTYAFYDCAIASITLPNSLTTINSSSFFRNTEMTTIVIPDNVSTFGSSVFSSCTGLTSYTLPAGITTIPNSIFSSCTGLTTISIPSTITTIDTSAFSGCSNVEKINLLSSNTLQIIGSSAFSGMTKVTNFSIPITVTSIGSSAFYNWQSLETISIPAATKTIGSSAFSYCKALTTVTIPETVTSFSTGVFTGCTSLSVATIHSNLTTIPDSTFSGCTSLTNAVFTSTITAIGSYSFYNCTSLKSYTISSDIKSIGSYAFNGCTGLSTVIIPSNVTTISSYAFRNLSSDVMIFVSWTYAEGKPSGWSSNWLYDNRSITYGFNG